MELTGPQSGVLEQIASAARPETRASFDGLGVSVGDVLLARAGQGFTGIFEAADGRTEADLYIQHRPDVVLLAMVMAGDPGQSTLRGIRRPEPTALVMMVSAVG